MHPVRSKCSYLQLPLFKVELPLLRNHCFSVSAYERDNLFDTFLGTHFWITSTFIFKIRSTRGPIIICLCSLHILDTLDSKKRPSWHYEMENYNKLDHNRQGLSIMVYWKWKYFLHYVILDFQFNFFFEIYFSIDLNRWEYWLWSIHTSYFQKYNANSSTIFLHYIQGFVL